MSSALDRAVKHFKQAIQEAGSNKTRPFDTQAEVMRVEDGVAWVHMPGGVDETPVQLTVNAKKGDIVQVRVAGGKAWLVGNGSAPPTDDTRAIQADDKASSAVENANIARMAADQAEEAAAQAVKSAAEAKETTDEINAYAETAGKTVTQILDDGETASIAAQEAKTAADTAFINLSQVQSVLEVAEWIATHGTYTKATTFNPNATYYTITATQVASPSDDDKDSQGVLIYYEESGGIYTRTADTEVDPLKTYYNVSGTPVAGAKAEDIAQYYTLAVSDAMADYIQSHLVLTDEGLWLIKDGSGYKLKLTNYGSYIVAPDGTTVVNQNTADGNIIRALDGTVIAHLGYGEGKAQSGSDEAPYYILGKKATTTDVYDSTNTYKIGSLVLYGDPQKLYVCIKEITTPESWNSSHWQIVIGNYSIAEGYETKASGWASHAEGNRSTASGSYSHAEGAGKATGSYGSHAEGNSTASGGYSSHAEGFGCTASGDYGSHAEGVYTTASGDSSHAEGDSTTARGNHSHAQNFGTEAKYQNQTAIGTYNDNQSGNAFEIGNGPFDTNRSNAFAVGWDGNVKTALDTSAQSGVDKEIYDALDLLGWDLNVIVQGMLDGKKTLAEFLGCAYHTPTAFAYGTAPNYPSAITTGTWYARNQFSGSTINFLTTDTDGEFFAQDTNGWKVKKSGIYKLSANNHINLPSSTPNTFVQTRFLNYTQQRMEGFEVILAQPGVAYGPQKNEWVSELNAGDIILQQFCRYSGSQVFRPSRHSFSIELLRLT